MNEIRVRASHRPIIAVLMCLLVAACVATMSSGCGRSPDSASNRGTNVSSEEPAKIKICYVGLTCEPAIFVAYEKGFFKEEGLDVELIKTDWGSMHTGLNDGSFHATYSFIMYLIKPIEMGLDLKLTGGIHTGCLRVQAGIKTDIKNVADLKGKKLGITHLGSPPFLSPSPLFPPHALNPNHNPH